MDLPMTRAEVGDFELKYPVVLLGEDNATT
jgi:hypothetical protein